MQPAGDNAGRTDVLVSVINVTRFPIEAVISGVLDDSVDTVRQSVGPSDAADTTFVCVDQLVLGDPLVPATPSVTLDVGGGTAEIPPFALLAGESFTCGDVIEIIISGVDADSFAVDVFALTPP